MCYCKYPSATVENRSSIIYPRLKMTFWVSKSTRQGLSSRQKKSYGDCEQLPYYTARPSHILLPCCHRNGSKDPYRKRKPISLFNHTRIFISLVRPIPHVAPRTIWNIELRCRWSVAVSSCILQQGEVVAQELILRNRGSKDNFLPLTVRRHDVSTQLCWQV